MKIILATGIYPPDIGGPATYCERLADGLTKLKQEVVVVTYGKKSDDRMTEGGWRVITVKLGLPILRWFAYSKALKSVSADAKILYAFSSVSCGVPIRLSKISGPKKILRLGGDFLWERYTDNGGTLDLRCWYGADQAMRPMHRWMQSHMRIFDHIVFSSAFQKRIYEQYYEKLPADSVIDNAVPSGKPVLHQPHTPFRLLFMGRFVRFKNQISLIDAMTDLPDMTLTLTGDGPVTSELEDRIAALKLGARVTLLPPAHGDQKKELFLEHDLLVLPSLTEISPNTALEARSCGLPVLLSDENGLRADLLSGMLTMKLRLPRAIVEGVQRSRAKYDTLSPAAAAVLPARNWEQLAQDHLSLFTQLL